MCMGRIMRTESLFTRCYQYASTASLGTQGSGCKGPVVHRHNPWTASATATHLADGVADVAAVAAVGVCGTPSVG